MKKRVLIFIVSYNAEQTLSSVLARIPGALLEDARFTTDVLVIDDCSVDETVSSAVNYCTQNTHLRTTILRNPKNLGYGGNQKLGYRYAIDNGYDFVALLHGDGQYAPEELPCLLEPLIADSCEASFGSRMATPRMALKGGMPRYKYIGNRILTVLQNLLVGSKLTEFHSGFRSYSVAALKKLPFELNSDDFDFDTEIIIQLVAAGMRIKETPIQTFYGDEVCHVNGIKYAGQVVRASLRFKLQRLGIFYLPKFDLEPENQHYTAKFDFTSSHSYALAVGDSTQRGLLLGCGPAPLVRPFSDKLRATAAVDMFIDPLVERLCDKALRADLDLLDVKSLEELGKVDVVYALDVIEHLREPELFLAKLREASTTQSAEIVITTGNVAFFPVRLMLLLGQFNYGKRGILDRTHTRLFTFRSLLRVMREQRFEVLEVKGVPAPFPLALGRKSNLAKLLLQINLLLVKLLPGFFGYQIFVRARPLPLISTLLEQTLQASRPWSDTLGSNYQISGEKKRAAAP